MIKLIASLIAMITAFVFVFLFPGSGFEETVIALASSIASALGLKSWRKNYGIVKEWFESKTVLGALIVVVPIIILVVSPLVGFELASWLVTILTALIVGGGGTVIWGIFDAVKKKDE